MTTHESGYDSGNLYTSPAEVLKANLLQETIAVTDFINNYGGYDRNAVDPVEITKGEGGNCFGALVLVVEEMKSFMEGQGDFDDHMFYIGFPSDHGADQIDGSKKVAHTTLFVVEPQTKTVLEANIMAYKNIPPQVTIEPDLSRVLQTLQVDDLTVVNANPEFRENYSVTKEGNDITFTVYEYLDGINTYLEALGKKDLFSIEDVRKGLAVNRHRIPNGIVQNPDLPVETASGIDLPLDEDF